MDKKIKNIYEWMINNGINPETEGYQVKKNATQAYKNWENTSGLNKMPEYVMPNYSKAPEGFWNNYDEVLTEIAKSRPNKNEASELQLALDKLNAKHFPETKGNLKRTIGEILDEAGANAGKIKEVLKETEQSPIVKTPIPKTPAIQSNVISEIIKDALPLASKTLGYSMIPIAALDLGKKMTQTPEEIQKYQKEKGKDVDLTETGLDVSILGSPIAKLMGYPGLSSALGGTGAALGGYLLGKQLAPGNEPYDPSKYPVEPEGAEPTTPTVIPPEQDLDKMYNYSKIKNLFKK